LIICISFRVYELKPDAGMEPSVILPRVTEATKKSGAFGASHCRFFQSDSLLPVAVRVNAGFQKLHCSMHTHIPSLKTLLPIIHFGAAKVFSEAVNLPSLTPQTEKYRSCTKLLMDGCARIKIAKDCICKAN
jgi:hypothetical protein